MFPMRQPLTFDGHVYVVLAGVGGRERGRVCPAGERGAVLRPRPRRPQRRHRHVALHRQRLQQEEELGE